MTRDARGEPCAICGNTPREDERRVLVRGRVRLSYCSQECLRVGVRTMQIAQRRARLRLYALVAAFTLAAAGAGYVRHLWRTARPSHTGAAPGPLVAEAPPEPITFGPQWPPTDDEWLEQFTKASWVYPLPGPTRRRLTPSRELFTTAPAAKAQARCRTDGRCGVDLGGELWGEHVYAAHDGVIDRVQRSSEDVPTGVYVRIAHWGGAVFTQYFHLAAIPTRLVAGTHVSAGDVIGLAGDTGRAGGHPHLHFALSVRPSSELPEVYWDPEPLMERWPLRIPERGSVAGLSSLEGSPERVAGMSPLHRAPLPSLRPPRKR